MTNQTAAGLWRKHIAHLPWNSARDQIFKRPLGISLLSWTHQRCPPPTFLTCGRNQVAEWLMFVRGGSCSGSAGVVTWCVGGRHRLWSCAMQCHLTQNLWEKQDPTCRNLFHIARLSSSGGDAYTFYKDIAGIFFFLWMIFEIKSWCHAIHFITLGISEAIGRSLSAQTTLNRSPSARSSFFWL